ncbi:hypothetical protein BGZ99_002506, partial [Dissophora globulifera]
IYEGFIRDLNAATTYQMGLRGTTDSILDLGALGMVEVKGIMIDVFAPVAGLQGLKQVDFISIVTANLDAAFNVVVSTFVDIHNPSNLTLHIGDLQLTAVLDFVSAAKAGPAVIKNLTLVPGDNWVIATASVSLFDPVGGIIAGEIVGSTDPIPFNLMAFDDATSNIALNAGLNELQTTILLPPGMLEGAAGANPPYSITDMALKLLPSTVDDGIMEMTMKFRNPFAGSGYTFLHPFDPASTTAGGITTDSVSLVFSEFQDDLTFSLFGNDTATLTFNIKLNANPAMSRSVYQSLVTESASGSVTLALIFRPLITIGQDPHVYNPFWDSNAMDSATKGQIPFKTGSDFGSILDWYDRQFPVIAAIPVATPSPTSTTDVVMPTSPAPSPSPVATTTIDPAPPAITVV